MKKTLLFLGVCLSITSQAQLSFNHLGTYRDGAFASAATEIVAHDPVNQYLFSTNGSSNAIDVIDISNPSSPTLTTSIDLSTYGGGINSVAYKNGFIACAVEATNPQNNGTVVFFNATTHAFVAQVTVGAMPDMVTFTPDGNFVLTANEGEPSDDYSVDPEGTISIIDVTGGVASVIQADVTTLDFSAFNAGNLDPLVNIYGNNGAASIQQDLEPEYIAVTEDSQTAVVICQENNAVAVVDLATKTITAVQGLGYKDHSLAMNALDASDDDGIEFNTYDYLFGMYQPDAIKSVNIGGSDYYVTANEGDSRDYSAYGEEERVSDLTLDPVQFPNASILQQDTALGRLTVTTSLGDGDNDGDYDSLFVFGARSFSIWNASGSLIYDSGMDFEMYTSQAPYTNYFNSNNDDNSSFQSRSDNKGPEPEAIEIIKDINGSVYVVIGLERMGGFMVYDISTPTSPQYVTYVNRRDFTQVETTAAAGDLAPECILYISAANSPNALPLLVTSNEVSGTVSLFSIQGLSVGIESNEQMEVRVYPNPANDILNFNAPVTGSIYAIDGSLVGQVLNQMQVSIAAYVPGMYLMQTDGGQVIRFVKQ